MSLVKAWRRELLGASWVAVVVPGTVCAALALLALAGGFGRLGSLGQLFSGPRIPAGPSAARHATGHAATPHAALVGSHASGNAGAPAAGTSHRVSATVVPVSGAPRLPLDHHAAGTSGPGSGSGSGGHGSGTSGVQPTPTSAPPTSAPPTSAPPTSASPTPGSPTPAPPPSHQPTAIDRVVAAGTAVAGQLPNPAGTIATQTLQSVGSTVDQVLPIPAPGSSS